MYTISIYWLMYNKSTISWISSDLVEYLFKNNLTMNQIQSIVYLPLFCITSCHLSVKLLIPFNSASFDPKKFSTKIFTWFYRESFLSFRAFCREWKRLKSLGSRFGKYSGKSRTDQTKSNIFSVWFLLNVALCYRRGAQDFLLLISKGRFLRRFSCTQCSCWEYKSV